jgi:hypothetical protein
VDLIVRPRCPPSTGVHPKHQAHNCASIPRLTGREPGQWVHRAAGACCLPSTSPHRRYAKHSCANCPQQCSNSRNRRGSPARSNRRPNTGQAHLRPRHNCDPPQRSQRQNLQVAPLSGHRRSPPSTAQRRNPLAHTHGNRPIGSLEKARLKAVGPRLLGPNRKQQDPYSPVKNQGQKATQRGQNASLSPLYAKKQTDSRSIFSPPHPRRK